MKRPEGCAERKEWVSLARFPNPPPPAPLAHLAFDQVDHALIVLKVYYAAVDPLGVVRKFFQDKDVMVELRLKALVGEVDAELLERVLLEDFEPENIENANETFSVARRPLVRLRRAKRGAFLMKQEQNERATRIG